MLQAVYFTLVSGAMCEWLANAIPAGFLKSASACQECRGIQGQCRRPPLASPSQTRLRDMEASLNAFLPETINEFWNVSFHRIPHHIEIGFLVAMGHTVTHASHSLPWNISVTNG